MRSKIMIVLAGLVMVLLIAGGTAFSKEEGRTCTEKECDGCISAPVTGLDPILYRDRGHGHR